MRFFPKGWEVLACFEIFFVGNFLETGGNSTSTAAEWRFGVYEKFSNHTLPFVNLLSTENSNSSGLGKSNSLSGNHGVNRRSDGGNNLDRLSEFEFVDSPDVTEIPHWAENASRLPSMSSAVKTGDSGIDKKSWITYINGTILHDVRISLVQPANIGGILNSASSLVSAVKNGSSNKNGKTGGYTFNLSDTNALSEYSNVSSWTPLPENITTYTADVSGMDNATDSDIPVANISSRTTPPPFFKNAPTTSDSSAESKILREKVQPVVNLEIKINAEGVCMSECLSKCYSAQSNVSASGADGIPLCLPEVGGVGDSIVSKNVTAPGNIEFSTTEFDLSTPVDVDPNINVKMLKSFEGNEPKLHFLLEDICLSENCVLKAADILKRMDKAADPCRSFYDFACGGYKKNEIPIGEASRSVFSDISSNVIMKMYLVLRSPIKIYDRPYVKLLKQFLGKCVGSSRKELFLDAFKELGGWPSQDIFYNRIPRALWGEVAFNWTDGMYLEYNLIMVNLTHAHGSGKWILNVGYPQFVKKALDLNSLEPLDEMERNINIVASALGIDNSTSRRVIGDVRIFMAAAIKYAKSAHKSEGLYSLRELKTNFTHLDVLEKLPHLLKYPRMGDNELIYVSDLCYLRKVNELIRDTPVKTQLSHLVLTALRDLSSLIGMATDDTVGKYCVRLTWKLFPNLIGRLYHSTFVSNSKVSSGVRIAKEMQKSMLNMLAGSTWIKSKGQVMDQVNNLKFVWCHHDEDDMAGMTKHFDENMSLLSFVRSALRYYKLVSYSLLGQKVNSTLTKFTERYLGEFGVNAFYFAHHVIIPSTALHESFFDPDVPSYVTYGGLGLILGHEIIHSVAENIVLSSKEYQNNEKCMIKIFNSSMTNRSRGHVDGLLTKDENIADQGGFIAAYKAFVDWHDRMESKEKKLPGLLAFSAKQMFWLSAAANWCQNVSPDFTYPIDDKHAPQQFRIDRQFANIPAFSQDFNCPADSLMNPKEKCSLW